MGRSRGRCPREAAEGRAGQGRGPLAEPEALNFSRGGWRGRGSYSGAHVPPGSREHTLACVGPRPRKAPEPAVAHAVPGPHSSKPFWGHPLSHTLVTQLRRPRWPLPLQAPSQGTPPTPHRVPVPSRPGRRACPLEGAVCWCLSGISPVGLRCSGGSALEWGPAGPGWLCSLALPLLVPDVPPLA